jgi:hypothetical protein
MSMWERSRIASVIATIESRGSLSELYSIDISCCAPFAEQQIYRLICDVSMIDTTTDDIAN